MSQSAGIEYAVAGVEAARIHDDLPLKLDSHCAHRDACCVRP